MIIYFTIPTCVTIIEYATTEPSLPLRRLIEADYVLFDYTSNFWIWLPVTLVSNVVLMHLVTVAYVTDWFYWSLLYQVSCLFKIIRVQFARLDEFREVHQFQEKLVEIVHMQRVAYRSVTGVNSAISGLLLVIYGACVLILCMTMMVLTIASGDTDLLSRMGIVLVYIFFEIFPYSMMGTELMTASTSIADEVYGTRWHVRPVSEQRSLLFVLSRSQRMAKLTAENFFVVSRATFATTLQSAFSYFTVLRQFYGTEQLVLEPEL
ncbi:odorant receptor 49b-like [Malaya genurostris]|uniref:odorant receptor 49b-like n=1 Tax=Malaya genurostris TaxID=325434 RepID=UPI0026F3CA25|nr:odorant receptor 49b-like [Malaya genurostris]